MVFGSGIGPAEELNLTYNTQPILVTASAAIWNVIQQEVGSDIQVVAAAGHSVGEYSALYAAGILLSLQDAVRLVKTRGELMDTAVPAGEGGMAAILGLDAEQIEKVCADASSAGVVEPANFNAPGQIVIAGTAAGIAQACIVAKEAGATLEKGMVPERIKSLTRSQWRTLAKGLAFRRDKRSATVREFLSGMERKRIHKGVAISAAAAVIIVVVLLASFVPGYLHDRELETLVRELKSGKTTIVVGALESVRQLDPRDSAAVLLDAKLQLIDWYQARQNELVNESLQLYDYPSAQKEIDSALEFYPDSVQIVELKSRLTNSRDQLLNTLNDRFNAHLAEGRLLESEQDDMQDVLRILTQVQPDHPLLQDPRLAAAYAGRAEELLYTAKLDDSAAMLVTGLQRFPTDASLINLRDKVTAEQQRVEREARIADLTEGLTGVLASLETLEAVDGVRSELQALKRLDPDAAVVKKIQRKTAQFIDQDITASIDRRRWDVGDALLQNYVDVLEPEFLKTRQDKLSNARDSYLKKIDSLYAALLDAVGKGDLDGKSSNSAQTILGNLDKAGADTTVLERARAAIGQGYLEQARNARAQAQWEAARRFIQLGTALQPGATLIASLQAEMQEIGNAEGMHKQQLAQEEVEAREAEKRRKIDNLYATFEKGLKQSSYQSGEARESLGTLEQLAAVNPSDPLVKTGRTQVANKLATHIRSLGDAQDWDKALSVSQQAIEVIPGSEILTSTLVEIERGRTQQLALKRGENIKSYRQSLTNLLAKPVLDENWTTAALDDLKILAEIMPEGEAPWLEEQRARIAALYIDKAREMRGSERFSEAKILLASAQKFVVDDPVYMAEQQKLAAAEAKFMEENKGKLLLARIEGDKQTFLTQTRARDVSRAKKTLAGLRADLPADDVFLTKTAPDALGNAYLKLAEGAAKKGSYKSAVKFVDAGIKYAPDMPELQQAAIEYQRQRQVGDARQLVKTTKSLAAPTVRQALDKLKADKEVDYAGIEREFAGILQKRIQTLSKKDYPAAEKMLAEAQTVFPASNKLAKLQLVEPVVASPAPASKPAPTPAPTPKPKPTTTIDTVKTDGVNCLPTLAGHGRRARGTCYDLLPGGTKGPILVVVPSGGGISQPFAISKYEISVSNYNHYCKTSGKCGGVSASSASLPVTGVSLQQAKAYAAWVSQKTGYTYRLPTDKEWSYAANAQGKQPGKDFNCRVMLGAQLIKGQALNNVNVGKSNGWGLKNYIGNAQEWVITGSGAAARGGAYQDSLSACELTLSRAHSGQPDEITGFRLVRSIKLGG